MEDNSTRNAKLDKRLTGASNIDEQLQEILDHMFRDYIKTWYHKISDDNSFLLELRKSLNAVISNLASRYVKFIVLYFIILPTHDTGSWSIYF